MFLRLIFILFSLNPIDRWMYGLKLYVPSMSVITLKYSTNGTKWTLSKYLLQIPRDMSAQNLIFFLKKNYRSRLI